MSKRLIDFDTHMKILNFLIHIQGIGVITEEQRLCYSDHIQDYLAERESNLEFMENFLKQIRE